MIVVVKEENGVNLNKFSENNLFRPMSLFTDIRTEVVCSKFLFNFENPTSVETQETINATEIQECL